MSRTLVPTQTVLFCVVPSLTNLGAIVALLSLERNLFDIAPYWMPLLCLASIASFVAYFNERVENWHAWSAIFGNGAMTIVLFALLHAKSGISCAAAVCNGGTTYHDFPTALYFSFVTFTTLGYGDFQPSEGMRLLAAQEALFGYVFLGFMVGAAIHWAASPSAPVKDEDPEKPAMPPDLPTGAAAQDPAEQSTEYPDTAPPEGEPETGGGETRG